MDAIEKYYKKVEDLIQEAKNEGVEIGAYYATCKDHVIDSGIIIGKDLNNCGVYKQISTWKK